MVWSATQAASARRARLLASTSGVLEVDMPIAEHTMTAVRRDVQVLRFVGVQAVHTLSVGWWC